MSSVDVSRPRTKARRPLSSPVQSLLAAVGLLVVAAALFVPGVLTSISHVWPEAAQVPLDGRPHEIDAQPGEPMLVWVWLAEVEPACEVRDGGVALDLVEATRSYERGGGTAAPWRGRWVFVPTSEVVTIECVGVRGSLAMVEPKPWLPSFIDGASWWLRAAMLCAALGVIALVDGFVGLVRGRTSRN